MRIEWDRFLPGSNTNDHYNDVIMRAMVSQITSISSVCSTVGLGADQRKHQSSASLAFVRGILTFGNRYLSVIEGGKQRSRLAGWVQLSAEAAHGP